MAQPGKVGFVAQMDVIWLVRWTTANAAGVVFHIHDIFIGDHFGTVSQATCFSRQEQMDLKDKIHVNI